MALSGCSWRVDEVASYGVLADPPDAGTIHRRLANQRADRAYTLRWPLVAAAEKDAIVAEIDAAKGGAGELSAVHPTHGTIVVRLTGDGYRVVRRSAAAWSVEVNVERDP